MSRSPQPYLPLASHVSATSFSLQFVCLSLHRSQDLPTFTICWLQVLSFVLWHRILERPPQMPSWRSTALNRPTFLLQLFLVNFQRSWNCFLVNAMSSKLKAFSILAKKIREVYLGWSAGRQMLAIPCNFLARSIHRHFFPLLRLMSHSDHLLHAKNKSCIFWTPAKKRCKITNNGMWLNSTVHLHSNMLLGWKYSIPRNHFWTDLTYLLQVQENVYDTLLLLVLFSINVSGDGNSPLPSQCARPDGAAWPKKQKRVWPPPSPLPLPPASAYITVWTPVQVESVRLDLARRYLLQSLSEGTPQGQPVWGWMKIKEWGELCSVLRRRISLKGVLLLRHSFKPPAQLC